MKYTSEGIYYISKTKVQTAPSVLTGKQYWIKGVTPLVKNIGNVLLEYIESIKYDQ